MRAKASTYEALADALAGGATIPQACAVARIGESTYWRWMAECSRDADAHRFTYGEYGEMSIAEARHLAEKICTASLHQEVLRRSRFGSPRKKFFQGEEVWKKDPKLMADAQDPVMWALMHGDRPISDVYARDANGALIQSEEIEPPSDALQLGVLKALGGAAWRDTKDVNVSVSGGVRVIGQPKPSKLIEQAPPDQQLIEQAARQFVGLPEEPEILEPDVAEDNYPVEVLPEPPRDLPGDVEPVELVTPGEDEVTAPIPAHRPLVRSSGPEMTALRRDLLAKMSAGVKNPHPNAPVDLGIGREG